MIRIDAYAKINLALDIIGRRADGYHELKSVMQELGLHDHVDLEVNAEPFVKLFVTGGDPEIPTDIRNIAVKAANLMRETYKIREGVTIHISKRIPSSAGLAGGSTDAAAVIRGMNVLFGLGLSVKEMMALGEKVGADVPFCIFGGTALAEGIGEKITALPAMPSVPVLLVKTAGGISTEEAYAEVDRCGIAAHPDVDGAVALLNGKPEGSASWIKAFGNHLGNVMEDAAKNKIPAIAEIEKLLTGCGAEVCQMSGSGPTVFALFTDETKAWEASDKIKACFASKSGGKDPEIILTRIRSGK